MKRLAIPIAALVLLALPAAASAEQVKDGSFEEGGSAWTFDAGAQLCTSICGFPAATGSAYAATASFTSMPTNGSGPVGKFTQSLAIPDSGSVLRFAVRRVDLGDISSYLDVYYDGTEITRYEGLPSESFTTQTVAIPSALFGSEPRELTFEAVCVNGGQGADVCNRYDIDDVSIAPPPADPGPPPAVGGSGPPPDQTPPNTKVTGKHSLEIAAGAKKLKTTVEFKSTESGSTFECKLDKVGYAPCSTPMSLKLKKGSHTFLVRSVDPAGNVDPTPARLAVRVRVRKPD